MSSVPSKSLDIVAIRDLLLAVRHSAPPLPNGAAEAFDALDYYFRDSPAIVRPAEVLAKLRPPVPRISGVYPACSANPGFRTVEEHREPRPFVLLACRVPGGGGPGYWFRHRRKGCVEKLIGLIEAKTVTATLAANGTAVWDAAMPWLAASVRTPFQIVDKINRLVGSADQLPFIEVSYPQIARSARDAIGRKGYPVTLTTQLDKFTVQWVTVTHPSFQRDAAAEAFGPGTIFAAPR